MVATFMGLAGGHGAGGAGSGEGHLLAELRADSAHSCEPGDLRVCGAGTFCRGVLYCSPDDANPSVQRKTGSDHRGCVECRAFGHYGKSGLGKTQGREYAEMIWIIDVFIVAGLLLIFFNLAMTVKNRKEPVLYVSVWYILAGVILTAVTYALGNVIWQPDTGALVGIPDAILLWFYGHNVFGLFLTPLAAGAAYYVIPRVCRAPLYSHTLSLLGFWALIVVYTHIGTHHLLQVPVPTWLKVVAIVDSVAMIIPVMAFLINIWYTAKGHLGEIHRDIGGKFVFTGTIMYFFVSVQGSMMALPQVQRTTHFNNWVVGHAHIGVFGFAGMIALGALYYILPAISKKPLYSQVPGRSSILASIDRCHGFCRGAHHCRSDSRGGLAQRGNRISRACRNSSLLYGKGCLGSDDFYGRSYGLFQYAHDPCGQEKACVDSCGF